MEVCNMDDQISLPGFRFHPTDEELVSFYLRRKVDKKPIALELIKQIDIYKHNPWDLPYESSNVGEKEWYFFCKRGRKYKNSIRPNRVTGSGFWKATGIDKPVYSHGGEGNDCIGLKKTLVYYRGSAGKGTKTDWMMHEFRLPPPNLKLSDSKTIAEEAEIWTLCRIFKRNVAACKRYASNLKQMEMPSKNNNNSMSEKKIKICNNIVVPQSYMNFNSQPMMMIQNEKKQSVCDPNNQLLEGDEFRSQISSSTAPVNNNIDVNDFFTYSNWDELRSVVEMF